MRRMCERQRGRFSFPQAIYTTPLTPENAKKKSEQPIKEMLMKKFGPPNAKSNTIKVYSSCVTKWECIIQKGENMKSVQMRSPMESYR